MIYYNGNEKINHGSKNTIKKTLGASYKKTHDRDEKCYEEGGIIHKGSHPSEEKKW